MMEFIANYKMSRSIEIFSSIEAISDFVAAKIRNLVSITPPERFVSIALSGGSTPKEIYEHLSLHHKSTIDWSRIHFFWGDERCVGPESDQSNYKLARQYLFSNIEIPESQVFRIRGEDNPSLEIKRYARVVEQQLSLYDNIPQFDLVWLGLGEDGHTASIYPGNIQAFNSEQLFEHTKHPDSNQDRVSATGRIINNAREVIFIVTGEKKSDQVANIIDKKPGWQDLPASLVNPENGELVWLLDKKAASRIFTGHNKPKSAWGRLKLSVQNALRRGVTKRKLVLSISLGFTGGIFPVLGTTTVLCTLMSLAARANLAIVQLVNWLVYALQLLLVLPFIRYGAQLFSKHRFDGSLTEIIEAFSDGFFEGLKHVGIVYLYGVLLWCITAIPLFLILMGLSNLLYDNIAKLLDRYFRNTGQKEH